MHTFMALNFFFSVLKYGEKPEKLTNIVTNRRTGISGDSKANILIVKLSYMCAEMLKIKLRW